MTMQNHVSAVAVPHSGTTSSVVSKLLQIAGAFFVGIVILYGAGFVQTSAVHNAAHDMRHSQGFPCH
jgi:cobalt transporter subunit CbtB